MTQMKRDRAITNGPGQADLRWTAVSWTALYAVIAGALQSIIPFPWDNDTAYHAAVGRLLREHGFLQAFPWTPFSWLSDHYADKELLFHTLFVPFAGLDWVVGARIVGGIAGTVLLASLYFVLRREGVRFAGLWALTPLLCSVIFIDRFVLVRPHLLSITLALLFTWACVRRRHVVLATVSALYPWAYVAFWQIPALLVIAVATARLLSEGSVPGKPAAVAAAGIAAGVALHPNAMNLLAINWIHMADVLFRNSWLQRPGFDLGTELDPLPAAAWLGGLGAAVVMTLIAVVVSWHDRRRDSAPLAFSLAAAGFCLLTVRSGRFAEYFVPFAAAAAALSSRAIAWRRFAWAVIGASAAVTLWIGAGFFEELAKRPNDMPAEVASALQALIPKESQVFTTDWSHTGWLMLALPERRFMVALDPTLFFRKDPDLYRLWYRICHEAPDDAAEEIRRSFKSRYVLGRNISGNRELFYRLSGDRSVNKLLYSDSWLLFDLGVAGPDRRRLSSLSAPAQGGFVP